ncbi:hypothetical protein [Stappia indica]|uniref:Uncharacterized protein n=1 Tax=Stappia indica TaxID=538381 RepID=A0A857CB51_9HYPH|nr:hypothetical protein [Stappia indica]QGZ35672.1 hypothetical protein GH266_14915 [Stappia indica]
MKRSRLAEEQLTGLAGEHQAGSRRLAQRGGEHPVSSPLKELKSGSRPGLVSI